MSRTEFAFDINEIAHHRMAPVHYLRHVGLEVPIRQVSLAFYQTYGLQEDFSGKRGRRLNVGGYRFATRSLIPRIAYAVTIIHRTHEPADPRTEEMAAFQREVARVSAEDDWDHYRRKAGIGTYTLAGFLFIVPKVGPLRLAAVKGPNQLIPRWTMFIASSVPMVRYGERSLALRLLQRLGRLPAALPRLIHGHNHRPQLRCPLILPPGKMSRVNPGTRGIRFPIATWIPVV